MLITCKLQLAKETETIEKKTSFFKFQDVYGIFKFMAYHLGA